MSARFGVRFRSFRKFVSGGADEFLGHQRTRTMRRLTLRPP
jgi:hypothetical protein